MRAFLLALMGLVLAGCVADGGHRGGHGYWPVHGGHVYRAPAWRPPIHRGGYVYRPPVHRGHGPGWGPPRYHGPPVRYHAPRHHGWQHWHGGGRGHGRPWRH